MSYSAGFATGLVARLRGLGPGFSAATASIAQLAQDRAVTAYTALVARGERVVGSGVVATADVVNADLETTEEPKAVEAAPAATATPATANPATAAAADAVTPAPKPRKRVARPSDK